MPSRLLKALLDEEGVKYVTITHSTAYTAQEIAASAHIPGKELAKTVIVKLDGEMAMVVMPATAKVDLTRLRDVTDADRTELATEQEFQSRFPECSAGAMPPFGNLYGMPVYADESLTLDEEIAFNAGSHTELMRLAYADFERLAKPTVAALALAPALA